VILLLGHAAAADLRIGVIPMAFMDLPDEAFADPSARFPVGGGLSIPFAYSPRPGTSFRATLTLAVAPGQDTVTWSDERYVYESGDHWTMVGAGLISLGGEVEILPEAAITPLFGGAAGGGVVATFHSFGGDTQALLDPDANDLEDPQNIDPYTRQPVPAAEVWAGMRMGKHVAVDIEAGYTVAFVSAAPLQKSPSELGAKRSAYALDFVRFGLGVSVPL
jgi:hypothetical protein